MTLSCMQPSETQTEDYSCSNCGRGMGEFSAMRSLELYGDIMCGKCIHEILLKVFLDIED